jgi:hypothetical protein
LKGAELCFATELASSLPHAPPKAIRSHALIGQNGTGKSNLIEALITIFRDVDLDRDASFDFELECSIRGYLVRIRADLSQQKRPFVSVDDKTVSQGYLLRNRELLPSHIFAYYSGRNERMEGLFQEHQRRFNRRQEITAEEVLPEQLLRNFSASESDIRARKFAYAKRVKLCANLATIVCDVYFIVVAVIANWCYWHACFRMIRYSRMCLLICRSSHWNQRCLY